MSEDSTAHLTPQTGLVPAISAWEIYLYDQGRSPNTVKSFLSDIRLLTKYVPPDRTLGDITTTELNAFFHWLEQERGIPCSPKSLARRVTAIKSIIRWLLRGGALLVVRHRIVDRVDDGHATVESARAENPAVPTVPPNRSRSGFPRP